MTLFCEDSTGGRIRTAMIVMIMTMARAGGRAAEASWWLW